MRDTTRFGTLLNVHPIELRASFLRSGHIGTCWCRSRSPQTGHAVVGNRHRLCGRKMGVFRAFFGCRGVAGFNACCSGASIGDGGFTLACISGCRGVIGCIVATWLCPVREKVRPAWPDGGCEREKVRPASPKWPKNAVFRRVGRVFSRVSRWRGRAGRTFSRKSPWRPAAGWSFSRTSSRGVPLGVCGA